VAGVGNVFVRADRRGKGLARTVLSATVAAIIETGVRTIGLNVERTNEPAIRAYESLGFRTALRYFEGMADRVGRFDNLRGRG
jgi:ribosomal protein S18 acetylase RimI-like enzyme